MTPTSILEQKGSFEHDPQRRAARENEPVPSGPLGDPPERFTRMERDAWRELAKETPDGVLMISDRVMVEMYCQLVARLRGEPDGEGHSRPLKAAEFTQLLNILGRMGKTPSDRARLNVEKPPKKSSNRFAVMAAEAEHDIQ